MISDDKMVFVLSVQAGAIVMDIQNGRRLAHQVIQSAYTLPDKIFAKALKEHDGDISDIAGGYLERMYHTTMPADAPKTDWPEWVLEWQQTW